MILLNSSGLSGYKCNLSNIPYDSIIVNASAIISISTGESDAKSHVYVANDLTNLIICDEGTYLVRGYGNVFNLVLALSSLISFYIASCIIKE